MSKASDTMRTRSGRDDAIRDAGLTEPEDVIKYKNIAYGKDPVWNLLDVFRPEGHDGESLPVIVNVHGGGWVYGDKELYRFYCMSLAQRGFAVVSFSYRLAPENKFPAPMEDVNAVFTWIADHAAKYGLDLNHLFAVGDSAGANLLGLYACVLTNPAYAARYDFAAPADRIHLQAVALNCGAFQMKPLYGNPEEIPEGLALMEDLFGQGFGTEESYMISVTNHVTPAFPPTFLMTSSYDFLKEQASLMSAELLRCNVPFTFRFYAAADKPLLHVFHCNMRLAEAAQCNDDECEYFRRFLRK